MPSKTVRRQTSLYRFCCYCPVGCIGTELNGNEELHVNNTTVEPLSWYTFCCYIRYKLFGPSVIWTRHVAHGRLHWGTCRISRERTHVCLYTSVKVRTQTRTKPATVAAVATTNITVVVVDVTEMVQATSRRGLFVVFLSIFIEIYLSLWERKVVMKRSHWRYLKQ